MILKFRAWCVAGMIPVTALHWELGELIGVELADGDARPISQVTLVQFTGLKDKNGKEIFEGDIVKCIRNDPDTGDWEIVAVVESTRNIPFNMVGSDLVSREIIGNIYENSTEGGK